MKRILRIYGSVFDLGNGVEFKPFDTHEVNDTNPFFDQILAAVRVSSLAYNVVELREAVVEYRDPRHLPKEEL